LAMEVSPKQLQDTVAKRFKAKPDAFTDVRRHNNDARKAAIYLHRKLTSDSVTQLAERYDLEDCRTR